MLLLGVVQAQAFETAAAGSYDLLATTILTSATSSVTFSSLGDYAADYQHLQIRCVTRGSDGATAFENVRARFNGDTGNNYVWHLLSGNGSSVLSETAGANQSNILAGVSAGGSQPANLFVPAVIDILDFANTSKNTTIRHLSGGPRPTGGENRVSLGSGAWLNTAALTSILLFPQAAPNFVSGSRFSLYGIRG